jgi:hypothetical protein
MPSSNATFTRVTRTAYRVLILTFPLLVASAEPSKAEQLSWIRFGSPCYDYDPYDRYLRFGRYYPYPRCHCARHLHYLALSVRKHKAGAHRLKKKPRHLRLVHQMECF